jgi:Ca2+-binding RTX toxin-like protein
MIYGGHRGDDELYGGAGADTLEGSLGADLFVLDKGDAGTDIIADFSVLEGDKIRIDADENNDDTLAELGLAVADNGRHANIVDASDNSRIYLTLHNIDHTEITDTNFATYFEVV